MTALVVAPMPSRFWRWLGRNLPWFDQAEYDRERLRTRRILAAAERIRLAYLPTGEALRR